MNSMERNGYATLVALTSRVALPPICHPKAFYTDELNNTESLLFQRFSVFCEFCEQMVFIYGLKNRTKCKRAMEQVIADIFTAKWRHTIRLLHRKNAWRWSKRFEATGWSRQPSEVYDLMMNIASYVIEEGAVLHDGETCGFTEDQKLTLTRSEGVYVEGTSIKIGF